MKRPKIVLLSFLLIPLVMSSCTAPARSRSITPVPAGHLYKSDYLNVHAPNSDGWHLVSSSSAGMEFARSGGEPGEGLGAQVFWFPLPQTTGEKEFISLIKKGYEADTDSVRFSIIDSEFQYSSQRSYPCVSAAILVNDREAQTSPSTIERLLLQIKSLYCRHPVKQDTGFSIVYSHRGRDLYPKLNVEAKDFIDGVQVPGH